MSKFDFIVSRDFRDSLESDYVELQKGVQSSAWKSVQVIAGSIVEALLVDYLVATQVSSGRGGKDPLKLELHEAITISKAEGVLTSRTADLCSVIRSYRNLIHPGRVVRMGEPSPDEESARIALQLVDIIVREVARGRRAEFGLTAEQVASKIEGDRNVLSILPHLIADVSSDQLDELLLDRLPKGYRSIRVAEESEEFILYETSTRVAKSFRAILSQSSEAVQQKVAARFVQIVRQESGEYIEWYRDAFFRASDLGSVDAAQRTMIKQHLISMFDSEPNFAVVKVHSGIGPYLDVDDAHSWLDGFVRLLIHKGTPSYTRKQMISFFASETRNTSFEVDLVLNSSFQILLSRVEAKNQVEAKKTMDQLLEASPVLYSEPPEEEGDSNEESAESDS